MAALLNICGALCSTLQSMADWRPLLECRTVTLPRRKTRWNLQGCPKLANRSQRLVSQCSPYCEDIIWGRHCCLTSFFPIVDTCLSVENIARRSCAIVPRSRLFGNFLGPAFPASRAQHISDLHSKFALGPHHVSKYGSASVRPLRLGEEKKKIDDRKKPQDENIMVCPIP